MKMYYGTSTNYVCSTPTSLPLEKHHKRKEHHWYEPFKFWTEDFWKGENVWHNLVMIGEIVGGMVAAPLTAGLSEVGALAAIGTTAAVETTIGVIGAGINTGIDVAYGHASVGGTFTNLGMGIAGGLSAGGLTIFRIWCQRYSK